MSEIKVQIHLASKTGVKVPTRATSCSAGYDIYSAEELSIEPSCFAKVSTGIKISMPSELEAQIRPRSGLAFKHGVTILNAPGTIDSDYRGEVCILLINHGKEPFRIEPGMRIAQMVFSKVTPVDFEIQDNLEDTARGEGGFGSTGTR